MAPPQSAQTQPGLRTPDPLAAAPQPPPLPQPTNQPSAARHVGLCSHGNHVDLLIDGKDYISRWFAELDALTRSTATPRELRHTAWRLDNIGADGRYSDPHDRLFPALRRAQAAGVGIRVRLSGHSLGAANAIAYRSLRAAGIPVHLDRRLASISGSHHEKFSVFRDGDHITALVGSIDLSRTRWDTPAHDPVSTGRYPYLRAPTHDTGVAITGPAAIDIAQAFDESLTRQRDADPRRVLTALPAPRASRGAATVTVLRTVPLDPLRTGATREYSAAHAYLNAISHTRNYLYLEDQYFWPAFSPSSDTNVDVLDQLLALLRDRNVDIYVLLPHPRRRSPLGRLQAAQRHAAMSTLLRAQTRASGRIRFLTPHRDGHPIYVHSKLLIVDDDYVQIGSCNVNSRSMFHDGELAVGIADRHIATELRVRLWAEHTGLPREHLRDPTEATLHLDAAIRAGRTHISEYRPPPSNPAPTAAQRWLWDRIVNPTPQQ